MKKTLVALAVLATAGTAFAQNSISLTGNFGVGLQRSSFNANKTHLAITDGGLTFAGKEDLGGGLAAGFTLNQDFFRWKQTGTATGRLAGGDGTLGATTDVFLTLGGGFGTVKVGQWESLSTAWTAGNVAPLSTPDDLYGTSFSGIGDLVQNAARATRLAYTTPSLGGFKGTLLLSDRTVNGANGPQEPKNEAGATLGFAYGIGGFNAALSAKSINVKDGNSYQLGGSYDFGVAKVGLGADLQQRAGGADHRIGYLVSVAAPIGPVTVGATYLQSDLTNDPVAYGVGVNYDISKRTAINLSAGKFDGDFYDGIAQGQARLKLVHSF